VVDWAMARTCGRNQGYQYTSIAYGHRCRDFGVRPLDGVGRGRAYDNALCGSFFATLECELQSAAVSVPAPEHGRHTGDRTPCQRVTSFPYEHSTPAVVGR
jgi:hypothetical protein